MSETAVEKRQEALPVAVEMSMLERFARDPNIDIDKIEKLMAIQERQQDKINEAAFNAALARAQGNIVSVSKNAYNGQTRSNYATLGAVMNAVLPVLSAEGLALSFDTGVSDIPGHTRHLAMLFHAQGHSKTYHLDMPPDGVGIKGASMMTATHALGSSSSYARRYLTMMICALSTADDNDGNGNKPKVEAIGPDILAALIKDIESATTLEALQTAFKEAHKVTSESNDRDALKKIIAVYDAGKIRLACEKHAAPSENASKPPMAPLATASTPPEVPPSTAPTEPAQDKLTKHEKDAVKIKAVLDNITDEVARKEISGLVFAYAKKQQPEVKKIDYGRYTKAIDDCWRDAQGSGPDSILPVFITAMKDRFK